MTKLIAAHEQNSVMLNSIISTSFRQMMEVNHQNHSTDEVDAIGRGLLVCLNGVLSISAAMKEELEQ